MFAAVDLKDLEIEEWALRAEKAEAQVLWLIKENRDLRNKLNNLEKTYGPQGAD